LKDNLSKRERAHELLRKGGAYAYNNSGPVIGLREEGKERPKKIS